MANDAWAEFFIGIGEDQNEISYAKTKLLDLDPQNASVFWGSPEKLLPNTPKNSVDNFIIFLPKSMDLKILTDTSLFGSLISTISTILISSGTLQIVTDIPKESELVKIISNEIHSNGLIDCPADTKPNFTKFDLDSFPYYSKPYLLLFCPQQTQ
jgi:hypothetical protein